MPELPDITVYVEALGVCTRGRVLEKVRLASPFLLRTVDPPLRAAHGRVVRAIWRQGKRIVFALETSSDAEHPFADEATFVGSGTSGWSALKTEASEAGYRSTDELPAHENNSWAMRGIRPGTSEFGHRSADSKPSAESGSLGERATTPGASEACASKGGASKPEPAKASAAKARALKAGDSEVGASASGGEESDHAGALRIAPETQTLYLVLHLMIAGRLLWKEKAAKVAGKIGLAAFDFENGSLVLTEAGSKKRASLHLVASLGALAALDRGGIEPLEASIATFREALVRENHTLKRALTDPRLFSGIGNAYSDEILHRARLSPMTLTRRLAEEQIARLHIAVQSTLTEWTNRLRLEAGKKFPAKVTAFRDGMAAHGRYGKPCPDCGTAIQRIVYAENECNYCPRCQTGGKLLADRALSRLMHDDWPKTIDELEAGRG